MGKVREGIVRAGRGKVKSDRGKARAGKVKEGLSAQVRTMASSQWLPMELYLTSQDDKPQFKV